MTPAPPSSRRTVTAPHTGLLSTCSAKEDFLSLLRRRKDRWMETDYVARTGLWQAAVDDKLLGFVYARSRNIRTPDVLFCHSKGYSALPRQWPKTWGCCFVIKPLRGYNDFGILLVEGGVDRFTGERVRGRDDVLRLIAKRPKYESRLTKATVYVESVVRPERSLYRFNETPPDFKFFTFGSRVGTVAIIEGRKTAAGCMAWVDDDFQRTDYYGCVCAPPHGHKPACDYAHCDTTQPPRPVQWQAMLRTAESLASDVGIHMRIDLFAADGGRPVLNEFTPWHSNGRAHCDLRPLFAQNATPPAGAVKVANALRAASARRDLVDVCRLGRLWRAAGAEEGGPISRPVPPVLRNWRTLLKNDKAKCELAKQYLTPLSWRQPAAPAADVDSYSYDAADSYSYSYDDDAAADGDAVPVPATARTSRPVPSRGASVTHRRDT